MNTENLESIYSPDLLNNLDKVTVEEEKTKHILHSFIALISLRNDHIYEDFSSVLPASRLGPISGAYEEGIFTSTHARTPFQLEDITVDEIMNSLIRLLCTMPWRALSEISLALSSIGQ